MRGIQGSKKRGITLTELLVTIAILAVLFTLLFIPMSQAIDQARRGRIIADLHKAADYALEIMTRELRQSVEILPQRRIHKESHTYEYGTLTVTHEAGTPLNALDEDLLPDDDHLARIDFVVRVVREDRIFLPPVPVQAGAYIVTTYYVRRSKPHRSFRYLAGREKENRRQIFRAQWQPVPGTEPTDADFDPNTGYWRVSDGWILEDFDLDKDRDGQIGEDPIDFRDNDGDRRIDEDPLKVTPPPSIQIFSHNALTPPDVDVEDLQFIVERDLETGRPRSVVIVLKLRKPTPGAKTRDDDGDGLLDEDPRDGRDNDGDGKIDEDDADVPSLSILRRVKVVLPNVQR